MIYDDYTRKVYQKSINLDKKSFNPHNNYNYIVLPCSEENTVSEYFHHFRIYLFIYLGGLFVHAVSSFTVIFLVVNCFDIILYKCFINLIPVNKY